MFGTPLTWGSRLIYWLATGLVILDTPLSPVRLLKSFKFSVGLSYLALYLLARFWLGQVTGTVREPYLDEVFHIPQAQAYCLGRYTKWDPKLTTPPGLYVFATIYSKLSAYQQCTTGILRSFNVFALIMVFAYASDCRALVIRNWRQGPTNLTSSASAYRIAGWKDKSKPLSHNDIHTALNIALFPLLFFFSGLFYTDILSTCLVLRMYRIFLERSGGFWLYLTGILALTMRQTNIFWVAVFIAGLELVRTIDDNRRALAEEWPNPQTWKEIAMTYNDRYRHGHIHDVQLNDAGIHDFALCAISIAVATISRPLLCLTRLSPYIGLIISFAAFVLWNGGVVLGDKANHVATIHIPQLLYIWPFMAFFSAPLLIPVAISFLYSLASLLSLPLFPRLVWKYLLVAAYICIALSATLFVIKFNTIIHPFTLADNRHYMFYVFRYTILRHPLIRYLLAPIYLLCAYLVYLTLCPPSATRSSTLLAGELSPVGSRDDSKEETRKEIEQTGPTISFVLILLTTTALSLITAPLVEPRYFIIPWVIWRLNIPSLTTRPRHLQQKRGESREVAQRMLDWVKFWGWEGHDYRLWFETVWFLAINAVTGYMFLYRGFEWKQEPGNVQRFMW